MSLVTDAWDFEFICDGCPCGPNTGGADISFVESVWNLGHPGEPEPEDPNMFFVSGVWDLASPNSANPSLGLSFPSNPDMSLLAGAWDLG